MQNLLDLIKRTGWTRFEGLRRIDTIADGPNLTELKRIKELQGDTEKVGCILDGLSPSLWNQFHQQENPPTTAVEVFKWGMNTRIVNHTSVRLWRAKLEGLKMENKDEINNFLIKLNLVVKELQENGVYQADEVINTLLEKLCRELEKQMIIFEVREEVPSYEEICLGEGN